MMSSSRVVLKDLVQVVGGGTPTRSKAEYYDGDIPWVTPKDMKAWEIDSSKVSITPLGLEKSTARVVPARSVLVVVRSGVLKHTLPVAINRRPVAINQDMKALICSERILPEYLAHFVKANSARILKWVRATTADNFPIERLKAIEFDLPSIPEQQHVVETLRSADSLRVSHKRFAVLADELLQATFFDMFGDPWRNSMGWRLVSLGDLLREKSNYGTMIPASVDRARFLCLRVANIQNWSIALGDRKYVDLPAKDIARHSLIDGDLILARAIATEEHLGKAIVAYPGTAEWAFDSHLMRLRFDRDQILPEYVHALLRSKGGRKLFLGAARRSAVQFNINTKEMSNLKIPVPPIKAQSEFAARVAAVNRMSDRGHFSAVHLEELFDSLRHQVFSDTLA